MGQCCASHKVKTDSSCCGAALPQQQEAKGCCGQNHSDYTQPEPHDSEPVEGCGCGCGHEHGDAGQYSNVRDVLLKSTSGHMLLLYMAMVLGAYVVGWFEPAWANAAMSLAMLGGVLPIARRGLNSLKAGQPFSIEILMIIAAIGATVIGEVAEAAVVVLLFLLGEILESIAERKAQMGIQRLVDLVPQDAQKLTPTGLVKVPADTLLMGDEILVGAGERIAADGQILDGVSDVDEAALTGESLPKTLQPGSEVMAGSVNGQGVLRIRVSRNADDNAIARVARLVREAQARKAPVQRIINRFARIYTPMIVGVAALVAVLPPVLAGEEWLVWIYRALALLLIGCPCALVISTPAALASALSNAAGRGILLKGGDVLEKLSAVTAVALDKTGTLTSGRPCVVACQAGDDGGDNYLAIAAGLSLGNSHPVSVALLSYAQSQGILPAEVTGVEVVPGQGVRGVYQGQSVSFGAVVTPDDTEGSGLSGLAGQGNILSVVRIEGRVVGGVALVDTLRPDAALGVQRLQGRGLDTVMLTGDSRANAEHVAGPLDLAFYAQLRPEDKMIRVETMQRQGHVVLKVGDGINDAPALAAAEVGVAFGGGTDVALETADGASLYNRVTDIADMLGLAKVSMRNIRQNIAIALGLKGVFLVTTILGVTGLWPAILADTGATVLVTANALRLLRYKA